MKIKTTLAVLTAASILAGCSQVSQSIKSVTKFGSQEEDSYKASDQSSLVVPPALALPSGVASTSSYQTANNNRYRQPNRSTAPRSAPSTLTSNKNYYVVVGTYPDSEQAMDTFVRLSSIGLPNATMESRATKTGKSLHMVRLGPFTRQAQIDKIKDSLMSDGLTQFKVVES